MRSDKKMYHTLFPRVGYVGERGHDHRLELSGFYCISIGEIRLDLYIQVGLYAQTP